jgi:hypothetical protein
MNHLYGTPLAICRIATAAIAAFRFVKGTATDGQVTQASSPTDRIVGAAGIAFASGANDKLDINHAGVVSIEFGGNIVFGDALTSDALGRAVPAKPGDRVCGIAMENGDLGTIGTCLLVGSRDRMLDVALLNDDGTSAAAPAFAANDCAPADIRHGAVYSVPATGAASTVTLPAAAKDGTKAYFVADGAANAHTVQYRDGTGNVNLTAALTAAKRHLVTVVKKGGAWYASAAVSP